ncbi:MAG: GGDEF domain-containing protein [Myxococcales bacterium]|nr:GGDEF domain-containing protein [Myxococcales bacterium]
MLESQPKPTGPPLRWTAPLDTQIRPLTLRFRPPLEQEYQRHKWSQGQGYALRLCLFGALANIGFGLVDPLVAPVMHPVSAYLQFYVLAPSFALLALVTLSRFYGPPFRWAMLAIYAAQLGAFVLVALLSSVEGNHRIFPFVTALLLAGGLLFRLSFLQAITINALVVGAFVWGSAALGHETPHASLDQTLISCTILLLGGLLHYSSETTVRQEFVHRLELALQATTDALTGLHNRRHFVEVIDVELARATREHRPIACLMFDLDHFKQINDSHGHRAGDAVLRAAAKILRGTCRPYDVVARYGGEEFVALLPGSSIAGARSLAERCREAIEVLRIPFDQQILSITTSAGIASSENPRVGDADSLLRCADEALYRAKLAGRNCTIVAEGEALDISAKPPTNTT